MSDRRTTMMSSAGQSAFAVPRPSIKPQQQQLIVCIQRGLEGYPGLNLTREQLIAPFEHKIAVQHVFERLVYELLLNQSDVGQVLSSFSTYECIQAVADDLGIDMNNCFSGVGKLHNEFVRGFLVGSCIDYIAEPLLLHAVGSVSDWFTFTEPPGSSMAVRTLIDKYKSMSQVTEPKKLKHEACLKSINDDIRKRLDFLLMICSWFSNIYDVLREELEMKFHDRDVMSAIQTNIADLERRKVQLEEAEVRDAVRLEELANRRTQLQDEYRALSTTLEQLDKKAANSSQKTLAGEEALREEDSIVERVEQKLNEIESQVVENPEQLNNRCLHEKRNVQEAQLKKQEKREAIMETKRNLESIDNYASDLQQAHAFAKKVFATGSASPIRRQRHKIESDVNVVTAKLDDATQKLDAVKMQLEVACLNAAQEELNDADILLQAQKDSDVQYKMLSDLRDQLGKLARDVDVKQELLKGLVDRLNMEKARTDKLERNLRNTFKVWGQAANKYFTACAQLDYEDSMAG